MRRRPEMPDRVLALGRVAAADMTALHAHPELHPDVTSRTQSTQPDPLGPAY
jgi:hypothetical protein